MSDAMHRWSCVGNKAGTVYRDGVPVLQGMLEPCREVVRLCNAVDAADKLAEAAKNVTMITGSSAQAVFDAIAAYEQARGDDGTSKEQP